jgi:hypothetical protein
MESNFSSTWPFSSDELELDIETRNLLDSILQPHISVLENGYGSLE